MHYIIGDVHGEYDTLLALITKLPTDAKLVFVGDLVDRGAKTKELVAFVRENNYQVVKGNHEDLFSTFGIELVEYLRGERKEEDLNVRWKNSGRLESFVSYGLVEMRGELTYEFVKSEALMETLMNDIKWMKNLPLFLELDTQHASGKQVVVSHSNISTVWNIRNDESKKIEFAQTLLWTRETEIDKSVNIFNIYGHTPQKMSVKITENYVNVDTGCCYYSPTNDNYGRLSAYCVESGEVVCQRKVEGK